MKKVAVIGFGFMGITHSQNILKCKNLKLAAIIEKDVGAVPDKLKENTGNFPTGENNVEALNKVPVYSSLEECLESVQLDAVHICVHTDLHYSMVKKALNFGLHVLVEKPFVLDIEEGVELIELAKRKKLILMVAHVVRFMPPYQKLVEMIDSGKYGDLNFLSLSRFSGIPGWGQWKEKQKDFGVSGGALFDLIIHDIDFALFALGKKPDRIESNVLSGKLSKHDYLNTNWKYISKSLTVKIEGGNIFHANFPFYAGFTAVFEKATVSFSTNNAAHIIVSDGKKQINIDAGDLSEGYFNEIQLFSESLKKGYLPESYRADSALETIQLCYKHI